MKSYLEDLTSQQLEELDDSMIPFNEDSSESIKRRFAMSTNKRKSRISFRRILVITAVISVLSTGAFAAYHKWSLPKPETYKPGSNGIYDVESEKTYSKTDLHQHFGDNMELSDQDFIQKAIDILKLVGIEGVNTEEMTVQHIDDLMYGRKTVMVLFNNDDRKTDMTFNESTGDLIGLSDLGQPDESVNGYTGNAEDFARKYYAALPVHQGYELSGKDEYDSTWHTFYFSRLVSEGMYNPYEQVRISINPENGKLIGCNVFYFPLLDDHEKDDEKLTKEQADEIAMKLIKDKWPEDEYVPKEASIEVVLPNWMYTKYETGSGNLKYCEVTRFAWVVTYKIPNDDFTLETKIYVDLYTGEILGGDSTK